jgi:hypothetical protein
MSTDEHREAQERIERFKRLGGVELGGLEPLEKRFLRSEVITGLANYKKTVFTYFCPLCGRIERSDQEMSPACTGPNWTDDHNLEPMILMENGVAPVSFPGLQ